MIDNLLLIVFMAMPDLRSTIKIFHKLIPADQATAVQIIAVIAVIRDITFNSLTLLWGWGSLSPLSPSLLL